MKKRIKLFMFLTTIFLIGENDAYAASSSIKSSSNSVVKGNKVTITYTVNAESPLVSIEGTLKCSGAGVNDGIDLRYDDSSNSVYQKSYTYTVETSSSGTLTCYTEGVRLTEMSKDNWQNIGNKNIEVTVRNPVIIPPKKYSSNNYLSNLEIEGYSLDKDFDKEVLEYNAVVPNGTETINIVAEEDHDKAGVKGSGKVTVNEGNNKIEIKVTAENGNVRTYIINVTVKELDPINVKIGKKEYLVVRKEGLLEPLEGYNKTTVKINDEDVLAYHSDITKYNLVILKDSEGNANYYIYDNNKYTLYKEYDFSGTKLYLKEPKDADKYIKREVKLEKDKITSYYYNKHNKNTTFALEEDKVNDYYLVYGMNVKSGKESFYLVDRKENSAIRYGKELQGMYLDVNSSNNYKTYFFITLGLVGILLLIISLFMFKKKTSKNK